MRTGTLVFVGWSCSDSASDLASWSLEFFCPMACVPPVPPAPCSAVWPVALALPAADSASDSLLCSTSPPSPGLKMRTEMFVLVGLVCVDSASDDASWLESFFCPIACCAEAVPAPMQRRSTTAVSDASTFRCIVSPMSFAVGAGRLGPGAGMWSLPRASAGPFEPSAGRLLAPYDLGAREPGEQAWNPQGGGLRQRR